jgi:hypothetical protein
MENEIYKQLVSTGRQDLANQFLSITTDKERKEERLNILEYFVHETSLILKSRKSASYCIEKISNLMKKICQ